MFMSALKPQNIVKGTQEAQRADRVAGDNLHTIPGRPCSPTSAAVTADERRALEFIAAESTGCLEHVLVLRGYSTDFLAGLIRSGLASVAAEHFGPDPEARAVFRLWITKRGKQALETACRQ
jgi:nitrogenase molybdenum-iron protein alpha/beta subunit